MDVFGYYDNNNHFEWKHFSPYFIFILLSVTSSFPVLPDLPSIGKIFLLSNKSFTFWKPSVTVLGPFSKLQVHESLSEVNESIFSKCCCFVIEDCMNEPSCISNHVLLALAVHLVQQQRQVLSSLNNYLFVYSKLDHSILNSLTIVSNLML